MGVRRWVNSSNVHSFFCPFGADKRYEFDGERIEAQIICPCQGEYCMAWGWYSDFFPDVELDDDDPKLNWGTCTLVPPAGDGK